MNEDHANAAGHDGHAAGAGDEHATALDPVCGMTVDVDAAQAKGLARTHANVEYVFCGKGCYLDFGDDPERYLDPAYVPSM